MKQVVEEATLCGLLCCTWSPGDGVTRYRFFREPATKGQDYFGPGDGIYTALGSKEALTWLDGFARGSAHA